MKRWFFCKFLGRHERELHEVARVEINKGQVVTSDGAKLTAGPFSVVVVLGYCSRCQDVLTIARPFEVSPCP